MIRRLDCLITVYVPLGREFQTVGADRRNVRLSISVRVNAIAVGTMIVVLSATLTITWFHRRH